MEKFYLLGGTTHAPHRPASRICVSRDRLLQPVLVASIIFLVAGGRLPAPPARSSLTTVSIENKATSLKSTHSANESGKYQFQP
jgi:hypothetical protein